MITDVKEALMVLAAGESLMWNGEIFDSAGVCQIYDKHDGWVKGLLLRSRDTGKTHAVTVDGLCQFDVAR